METSSADITLDRLQPGQRGSISSVGQGELSLFLKLMSMGIVPGVRIEVLRRAPLGDPIAIKTTGHDLSIRLSEARVVKVALLND